MYFAGNDVMIADENFHPKYDLPGKYQEPKITLTIEMFYTSIVD